MRTFIICCIYFLLFTPSVYAKEDLYNQSIPIPRITHLPITHYVAIAMEKEIFKLTGSRQALNHPQIRIALARAFSYAHNFKYVFENDNQKILNVIFNKEKLNTLLKENDIPFWAGKRPTTLVWVAAQDEKGVFILQGTPYASFEENLQKAARDLGLSIDYPIQDLETLTSITPELIYQQEQKPLWKALQRYPDKLMLAISIDLLKSPPMLHIQLTSADNHWNFAIQESLDKAPQKISQFLLVSLSKVYDSSQQHSQKITIHVSGVSSLDEYSQALDKLQATGILNHINVDSFDGNILNLHAILNDTNELLYKKLSGDDYFTGIQYQDNTFNIKVSAA